MDCMDDRMTDIPADRLAEFEAASRRPLAQRWKYAFIRTHKPVMDDARFRAFETMDDYRRSDLLVGFDGGELGAISGRPDLESATAQDLLAYGVERFGSRLTLACSFQKEEAVLLDMLLGQAERDGWRPHYLREHVAEHAAAAERLDQLLESPESCSNVLPVMHSHPQPHNTSRYVLIAHQNDMITRGSGSSQRNWPILVRKNAQISACGDREGWV